MLLQNSGTNGRRGLAGPGALLLILVTLLLLAGERLSFIESSDCHNLGVSRFDFVHSYIVFQHIPIDRGYDIFERILASLKCGGVGVLHFTYHVPSRNRVIEALKKIPYGKQLRNFLKKRGRTDPVMQMNEYDINIILTKIHSMGVKCCYLEFSNHDVQGVTIYFQKA